jgi:GT2 family glycosyltransferase
MTPVTVCIVSYQNPGLIAECLEALGETTFKNFEVVICENGGEEAFQALNAVVAATHGKGLTLTTILAPSNDGYASGVNICMRARPDARAWWVLNPDTTVEPETLSALIARLERGDCQAVGGTLYHPDGKVQAYGGRWRGWLARPESLGHGAALSDNPDVAAVERQMHYLLGASMLIGREFVKTVGLMREDYFLYAEEVEWCLRAKAKGMRLGFAPEARVCHGQGSTTGSADSIKTRPRLPIYMDERNKLLVVRDTSPLRLPVAIGASFVLAWLRFGRRGATVQWRHAMAGWWAGVRNQRGLPPWLR